MKRRKFVQLGSSGIAAGTGSYILAACTDHKSTDAMELSDIKTPVCDLLGIEFPVFQAGMGDVAGPELVAAVSNAGGLGILTATMVAPDTLKEHINKIRELTDKPFGVNLILHQDLYPPAEFDITDKTVEEVQGLLNRFRRELGIPESNLKPPKLPPLIQLDFEVILQENVPVFSVGLGNPSKEMVDSCHQKGIKVMAMVSTVEDALAVYQNGIDIIVAQGSEAGGHRSTWEKKSSREYAAIGTLPLSSAIIAAVTTPVIAAGGIVNGKGLKACLALGAQGVLIGTRFIATKESIAPESYKQAILKSSSDQTTVTDVFTGMYARVIRNTFTETYSESKVAVLPPGRQLIATHDIIQAGVQQQNPEFYALYAGQGIDEIKEINSARDVVISIVQEAIT